MVLAMFVQLQLVVGKVYVEPNPKGLPGTPALEKLVNGLAAIALLACVAGVLIGAAQWALGSKRSTL